MPDEVQPEEPTEDAAEHVEESASDESDNESDDEPTVVVRVPVSELERSSEILQGLAEPIMPTLQQQADVTRSFAQPLLDKLAAIQLPKIEFPAFETLQSELTRALAGINFDALEQAWRRGWPPNWLNRPDGMRLSPLLEITESGLPTAWVPRALVLDELVDAPANDRAQVFANRRQEIIEDCRTVLADVTSAELADYADALDEALAVAEAGQLRAAQSLAASVFDTILRRTIKPQRINGYYAKAKAEITDRHENALLTELRWGLVHVAAIVALDKFDQPQGDPIPMRFNRHASAHAVGPVQYTPANAVIALALATSLVRESHQEIVHAVEAAA